MGIELITDHHWFTSLIDAYPTVLSSQVSTVSDFQILVKSQSIESRSDQSPKSEVMHETKFSLKISYSTHVLRHIDADFVQK